MKDNYDIIRLTENQANWLSDIGNDFGRDEFVELIEHPALPDVVLDINGNEGRLLCRIQITSASKLPKEALSGRIPTSKNAMFLTAYQIFSDKKIPIFSAFEWDTVNDFCGALCAYGGIERFISQDTLKEQEAFYTNVFLAIQHFMMQEHDLLESKHVYDKVYASKNLPLTAPYSKPGYVKVRCLAQDYKEKTDGITRNIKRTEWHCPAWGVRGHYRHYKSGKVVYVKSYIKGKEKSLYLGREYKFEEVLR